MVQHATFPTVERPRVRSAGVLLVLVLVTTQWVALDVNAVDVPFPEKLLLDSSFSGAQSVISADFDGDGDVDLLGAASDLDDIVWWENTLGTGATWIEHVVDAEFSGPASVYAADVDGDGDVDVVGAASQADEIAWWENTAGDGSAWTKRTVGASFDGAASVWVADLDGDGDLDVLGAAGQADEIAWWENSSGDGSSWTKFSVDGSFDGAASVGADDVDGDGDADVLAAASQAGDVSWWENTAGDGSTWTEHVVDSDFGGAASAYAADVDGDGDSDVLGAASQADDLTWWENVDGDGSSWTEHSIDSGFDGAASVVASDVDGDGDLDALGAANGADEIAWWENTASNGSSWTKHTLNDAFNGAVSAGISDVDGDGDADIFGAASLAGEIAWWKNTTIHRSALLAEEHVFDTNADLAWSVIGADIDGDGDTDAICAERDADTIAWWENTDGMGTAWTKRTVDAGFSDAFWVHSADLDLDGDSDILGAAAGSDEVSWWENSAGDGSTWSKHLVDDDFLAAVGVFAVDVDGDGDTDVLGAASGADEIAWWENLVGDGASWTHHTVDGDFDGASSVFAEDLDGDGDIDVLGCAWDEGSFSWWENTSGDGTSWSKHLVDGGFTGAASVSAADVDGDGDADILGAAVYAGDIMWWENASGDGSSWTRHVVAGDFHSARRTIASDLDCDGDIDVVGATETWDFLKWWENVDGDGSSWQEHVFGQTGFLGASIFASDIDSDGDPDIFSTAPYLDRLSWWENLGGQFALSTGVVSPAALTDGEMGAILDLEVIHRGRLGDSALDLARIVLLFEIQTGVPLNSAQANALVEDLLIYLDDGSGAFDQPDTLVKTLDSLSLSNGIQNVDFSAGDPQLVVEVDHPSVYFVVARATSTASSSSPNEMLVTHLTDEMVNPEVGSATDHSNDILLFLEWSSDATSTQVTFRSLPLFSDGFESGDFSAWSGVGP